MTEKEAFDRCMQLAAEHFDPPMAAAPAMAKLCNVTRRAVYKWTRIPAEHCRNLEKVFGGKVTRYQMRPDIFGPGVQDSEAA